MIKRDRLAVCLKGGGRPFRIQAGLVAGRLKFGNAVLEGRIVEVGKPPFNGGIKPLEPGVGLRRPFGEFGGDGAAARRALLAPVEQSAQRLFQPFRVEQAPLKVGRHEIISFRIGTERPLQPVSPWRAAIEQV